MSKANKREIIEKSIKVFSIRIISYAFGFLFILFIANKFGTKTQGIFSIAFLFLSICVMIAKLGIETSLVKWIASAENVEKEKFIFKKAITITIISGVFIGLILFLCAPLISYMYNKPDVLRSIQLISIGIPFLVTLDVASNLFKGRKQTTTFAIYFYLGKFLFALTFILILYFLDNKSFEIPAISYVLGLIIVTLIIIGHIIFSFKGIEYRKDIKFTPKFILLESYPMMISSSIVMIMSWSDVFILGFFVSEEQIGIYSTAVKLATIVTFVYAAIVTIVAPKIANFFNRNEIGKLKETISFSSRVMVITGLPIFLILFIFPEFFLSFFGQEYIKGNNVLRILLLAQLTNVLTGAVGPILNMTNRQRVLQKFIIIALIVNLSLSLILVINFGVEGVAIASAIGMILWNIIGAYYIFNSMNIRTWISFKKVK